MMRYVAFLRGINLGRRRVTMTELAAVFTKLGYTEVATFIASGNVIFSTNRRNTGALEVQTRTALKERFGFDVEVFVRTAAEVTAIAGSEMFRSDEASGATVYVGFMSHTLDGRTQAAFEAVRSQDDWFRVVGREFYWMCRTKISESRIWEQPEAKRLKLPSCTLRNMSTIRKLVAKHLSPERE